MTTGAIKEQEQPLPRELNYDHQWYSAIVRELQAIRGLLEKQAAERESAR